MEVNEQESMGNACEFALLSIRNMIIPPVDMINSKDDLEKQTWKRIVNNILDSFQIDLSQDQYQSLSENSFLSL